MATIGIDLGGTSTRVGLVKNDTIIKMEQRATVLLDPEENFKWTLNFIKDAAKTEKISFIGISSPGPLDTARGVLLETPNLRGKWIGFSVKDYFEKALKIKTKVENDANVAALAHAKLGVGQGYKVVQFFTISTGLGAGMVFNGQIFQGEYGFAQEVANVPFGVDGFKTGILNPGAVEAVASGEGIKQYAISLGLKVKNSHEVFKLAEEGDKTAQTVVKTAQTAWARLFATAIDFCNPGIVVISGGVAKNNQAKVQEAIDMCESMLFKVVRGKTVYAIKGLSDESGILGAASMAEQTGSINDRTH